MIVCHCRVVNDAAVRAVMDAGETTLSGVCQSTGAGQDCGSCVFAVKALVCEHDVSRTPTLQEMSHAPQEPANR